jgi:hypothetical protein
MSFDNAISQRAQMNIYYTKLLEIETSAQRIEEINKQIELNKSEILELRNQQQNIFGKREPLKQTETVFEVDPENRKTQKVTVKGEPRPNPVSKTVTTTQSGQISDTRTSKPKALGGNKLRDFLAHKKAASTENSLKSKIAAARATKTKTA